MTSIWRNGHPGSQEVGGACLEYYLMIQPPEPEPARGVNHYRWEPLFSMLGVFLWKKAQGNYFQSSFENAGVLYYHDMTICDYSSFLVLGLSEKVPQ